MTVLAWLLLSATVIQLGNGNHSIPTEDGAVNNSSDAIDTSFSMERSQTGHVMQVNMPLFSDAPTKISARSGREKREEPKRNNTRASSLKAREAEQQEKYNEQVRMLSIAFGTAIGVLLLLTAIAIIVLVIYYRSKNREGKGPKREELPADNGLTIIRREGLPDKYVVKGCDFQIMGPLVRGKVNAEAPAKHMLDDQTGGDVIDDIFFDKNLNQAFFIGEGVEIVEEGSVSVGSERKEGASPVEQLAAVDLDDDGKSEKARKKPNAVAKIPDAKKSSKSSKSKRAKNSKLNPPSSGSNPKNPSSSGSDGKKK